MNSGSNNPCVNDPGKNIAVDKDLPPQTEIRYSGWKVGMEIFLMMGFVFTGIYLSYTDNSLWLALILIAIVYFFKDFRKLTSRAPQIILDDKGIKIREADYPWSEISKERAYREDFGKRTHVYLSFEVGGKTVEMSIRDYDITVEELQLKLTAYRARAGRKNS